jgi:hypothetical protein
MYKDEHVPHQLLLTRVRGAVQPLLRILSYEFGEVLRVLYCSLSAL